MNTNDVRPGGEASRSVTGPLQEIIRADIAAAGGWIGFDRFMAQALYAPGLGYYANDSRKFGSLPASGSDFVTAPELTPLFGQTLARQLGELLRATDTDEIWEFGAGSGALARQLLDALGPRVRRYTIVDLSGSLRARQREALAGHQDKLVWADALPDSFNGVVVGNEVLDAMPVQMLARMNGTWHERGVAVHEGALAWADRPTDLRPPIEVPGTHDYVTEIHRQAEAFVRTLGDRLQRGAALFLDYGFPEDEYYHPQRHMGTLVGHRGHKVGAELLADAGLQDLTAHVNFTGVALAAQEAGFDVLGYTSQARFLLNAGIASLLAQADQRARLVAQHLLNEHEMGELFKVIALAKGVPVWEPIGFTEGDRTHRL